VIRGSYKRTHQQFWRPQKEVGQIAAPSLLDWRRFEETTPRRFFEPDAGRAAGSRVRLERDIRCVRKLENVTVVESKEADTNLPSGCCDAIFLRRVYHHLTKPVEFDRNLARSLKPGGRLAIIDFAPRSGLEPVEGVPSNRGGHGIAQKLVIEELRAAGFEVEKIVNDWPDDSYCVLLVKR